MSYVKKCESQKRIIWSGWKNNFLHNLLVIMFCPKEIAEPPLCSGSDVNHIVSLSLDSTKDAQ